jgi:hypothetical protein
MAIKEIHMLPQTLLEDIDIWLKNPNINVMDVWGLIEKRFQSEIKFTKRELSDYMVERRQYLLAPEIDTDAIIPLPRNANAEMQEGKDKSLDGEIFVNVRDRARLMHMLKEKLVHRMYMVEQAQKIDGKDYIDPYMESLVINYTKVLADIVEKEVKLQLELEESSKLEKMISERLNLILFLIWKSVQKFLSKEYFTKFKDDKERYEAFKKEIKEVFGNYGLEEHGKFE